MIPAVDPSAVMSDVQLRRRLERCVGRAHGILGRPSSTHRIGTITLSELIGEIEARLLDAQAGDRTEAPEHVDEVERAAMRVDSLANVTFALDTLRALTSPSVILSRAPEALCEHSSLDRVVVSVVDGSDLRAVAVYFRGDPSGAAMALDALRSSPMCLAPPLLEAGMLRRRRATVVSDARPGPCIHRATAETMKWRSYLVAPLLVGRKAIGAIHADVSGHPGSLERLGSEVLWTFAQGLGDAYETSMLRRSLRHYLERTRVFGEWLTSGPAEHAGRAMQLIPDGVRTAGPPDAPTVTPATASTDDRISFRDVLTRREVEVLRLLSRGESNGSIAMHLVITEATVKFHVANVLRKLDVSSRAEAVSRYHRVVSPATGPQSAAMGG